MNAIRVKHFSQYLTPVWAAEALVERHFSHLGSSDLVIEPSCGRGSFLQAIPAHVPAIGVDIDPSMVASARELTGREIILGDFAAVPLDVEPTVIVGNPPFKMATVDQMLDRAHALLPMGGQVGFILPAFAFQTARRVADYADRWSLFQEMIPRNLFPELECPLVFAIFSKDRFRKLVGFALYREMADVQGMPKEYREEINAGSGPVWLNVARAAVARLGGECSLEDVYGEVEGKRPTRTKFWREQLRKVLRHHTDVFTPVGRGRYALV